MPKTRRTKTNRSPQRPYRNARAFVLEKGDMITTTGVRGRTQVKRVTDETGKRLASARLVADVPQTKARDGVGIFVGRVYTGVARSKVYPVRSTKRGAVKAPAPKGLLARARRAVKKVLVMDGVRD